MPPAIISLPFIPAPYLPGQPKAQADLANYSRSILNEAAHLFSALETVAKDGASGSIPSYDLPLSEEDYNETAKSVARTQADRELSWTKIKPQSVPDGHSRNIPVQLFAASRVCTTADGHKEQENWFSRYSKHSQDKASGGVTWDEWKSGLLVGRAENELEYVGSVKEVHKVFEYPNQNLREGTESADDFPVGGISVAVLEVVHALPPPLSKRTFPVLAISSHLDPKSFTTVQIPVDHLEELVDGKGEKLKSGSHKKGVLARYVSIERVRLLEDGDVEWMMGTASDAGGVLPGFVQKLGIPGTIAKDVGWFVGWSLEGQPRKSQSSFN